MDELDKKYYKIKDVSDMLGVTASTLRYWEQEFPECKPRRSSTNIRYYNVQDIKTLKIIHYLLKIKGLKIDAAKEQLHANKSNVSNRVKIIETLTDTRNQLKEMLDALNKRR